MSDNIEARVKKTIAEQLNIAEDKISNDAHFVTDLEADSLDLVELTMAFENEFGISIPDEISNTLTTVQSAIDYIKTR